VRTVRSDAGSAGQSRGSDNATRCPAPVSPGVKMATRELSAKTVGHALFL